MEVDQSALVGPHVMYVTGMSTFLIALVAAFEHVARVVLTAPVVLLVVPQVAEFVETK